MRARVVRIMPQLNFARGLDGTGDIILDDIYNAADPSAYYLTLGRLDYVIPMVARAVFIALIDGLKTARDLARVKVADVGCSYGANAAVLKYDFGFAELMARYASKRAEGLSGARLLQEDRALFTAVAEARPIDVVGVDAAERAIAYARAAHIIDAAVVQRGEAAFDAEASRALQGVDMVISTAGVGGVGAPAFVRVVEAAGGRPWVAAFVLRQLDFEPIAQELATLGYRTETLTGVAFPQRRFAGDEERAAAFERLAAIGRRPTALEHSGWYASTLHVARPEDEADQTPLQRLLARTPIPAAAEIW